MLSFGLRVYWDCHGPRPDVIVGSSPHPFGALSALALARRFCVPFVLEVRDLWPESLVELASISRRHPLFRALLRIESILYRNSDRILTLLPCAAEYIAQRGGPKGRIEWIPNGVDLAPVPPPPPPADGVFRVMYAGSHGTANGLDALLDAAGGLSRVRFILMGDGTEKARLRERACREGLSNVEFRNPVPKGDVVRVLQSADACLMILKKADVFSWGISPNKLFDYFAAGRPVLFGVSTPHNPVEEARAGFTFAPDDPASLCKAIRRLMELPKTERDEMGLRGTRYVEQRHDWRRLGIEFERNLLESIHSATHNSP